ncbi:MAG: hypothetical protein Q9165_001718 [Trypethelium subeluteriae]
MSEDEEEHDAPSRITDYVQRDSVCFAQPRPYIESLPGTKGFQDMLSHLYAPLESNALHELINLKSRLRNATSDEFWMSITEGLARLTGAQIAFVSKRILYDEHDLAVEMPPLGEPGSCLMASSLYFEDEAGHGETQRNWKYQAFQCPCAGMKHDKVFLIPERYNEYATSNPNQLSLAVESYLSLPLFADGKCFAHFGVFWSPSGAANRELSWGFLEMMLHSLEDMIIQRLLEGDTFLKHPLTPAKQAEPNRVIPHEAVTPAQSLKPYARSLSHELRTPMQGVVGMLDVMYATLQEASEDLKDPRFRKVFDQLKNNIETVQDSSRRAMEAADNVVHAYDMNMGVPEVPENDASSPCRQREGSVEPVTQDRRPDIVISGSDLPIGNRTNKRKRESVDWCEGVSPKIRAIEAVPPSSGHQRVPSAVNRALTQHIQPSGKLYAEPNILENEVESIERDLQRSIAPGLRHTNIGELLQYVVNDSLKVGGRPETTVAHLTETGEIIEVTSIEPDTTETVKIVEWSVDPQLPDSILVDEKDLSKMISCVVLNALKFTDEGRVTIKARLSSSSRHIVITVVDTGPGIPEDFLPNLFKPFSQEDSTRTRKRDGLGLGLLVAKGISRRLGGTLTCIRADISGPRKGTEFEMRVPVIAAAQSRSGSNSPAPSCSATAHTSVGTISSMTPETPNWDSPEIYGSRPPPMRRSASKQSPHSEFGLPQTPPTTAPRQYQNHRTRRGTKRRKFDNQLSSHHPLNFLIAEDNKINRMLLANMLRKLGYSTVYEAHDGTDAVRQMEMPRPTGEQIDVVLMDLWMPLMDGYEATERILGIAGKGGVPPTVLAVTADVTEEAMERAWKVGMKGLMTKPYKLVDLEGLIREYCASTNGKLDVA